jgi:hypothetical protein
LAAPRDKALELGVRHWLDAKDEAAEPLSEPAHAELRFLS